MPLRKVTASGMAVMSTGGTIRLPRVKLPPVPTSPAPATQPQPAPAAPAPDQDAAERVVVVGKSGCTQVLETMKELVDAGISFSYCDAEQEADLMAQVKRVCGPVGTPVVITVRVIPE